MTVDCSELHQVLALIAGCFLGLASLLRQIKQILAIDMKPLIDQIIYFSFLINMLN